MRAVDCDWDEVSVREAACNWDMAFGQAATCDGNIIFELAIACYKAEVAARCILVNPAMISESYAVLEHKILERLILCGQIPVPDWKMTSNGRINFARKGKGVHSFRMYSSMKIPPVRCARISAGALFAPVIL